MAKRRNNRNRTRPRAQSARTGRGEARRPAARTDRSAAPEREAAPDAERLRTPEEQRENAGQKRAESERSAARAPSRSRSSGRRRSRGRRAAPQNVEPFTFEEARRSRPRRRRREPTGRAAEVIYRSLLVLMISAALFFIASVFFEVKRVEVTGSERYLSAYVEQVSGIEHGDKLLFLNEFQISQRLFDELPYVKSVKVRRRLPNTVVLEITERTPVAKLVSGDVSYIIDEEACLLDYTVLDEDYNLPVINGASPASRDLGKPMNFEDPLMLDSLRSVVSELVRSNWMEHVTDVNVEKIYSISFTYAHRFTVILGDAGNLTYKLSLLEEVLSRLHETDQGVIDLSTPEMARFQPAILQ